MKAPAFLIILFVFASFVLNAQIQNQTTVNEVDTITKFSSDTYEYRFIQFNFTKICPIEMADIPEGGTVNRTRNPDTGEMIARYGQINGFRMGKAEITQLQWEVVMGYNPSYIKGYGFPVENVSWNEIQLFIKRLNCVMGTKYRLPTEFEWEYAAGDGDTYSFNGYAGTMESCELEEFAWYRDNSWGVLHEVKKKLPNALGLYDMSGNVSEWCKMKKFYKDYEFIFENLPDTINTIRGGSWASDAEDCAIRKCEYVNISFKSDEVGFRLMTDL